MSAWIGPNSVVVLTKAQVSAWRVQFVCAPCLGGNPNLLKVLTKALCVCRRILISGFSAKHYGFACLSELAQVLVLP